MKMFKGFFKEKMLALCLSLLMLSIMALPIPAQAATKNYSEAIPGIQVIPFHISGQYTATAVNVVKFNIPFKAEVLSVQATARASGGTSPTLTVDVKEAGTTILSSVISITAGTVSEGTLSDTSLADESAVTVDFTIGGTTPTWNDITVLITVRRTN